MLFIRHALPAVAATLASTLFTITTASAAPGDIVESFTINNISGDGRTPTTPQGITYHDGFLWVVDFGTDRIYRVYPSTVFDVDEVTVLFNAGDSDFNIPLTDTDVPPINSDGNPIGSCFNDSNGIAQYCGGGGLTYAENFLWNASPITDDIIKIDPVDGDNLETENALASLSFPSPTDMTFDGTHFIAVDWQSNTINRILPEDGTQVSSFGGPSSLPSFDTNPSVTNARPFGITWDGQALWVSEQEEQLIYRINPNDGSLLNSFASPGSSPKGLAWDGEFLWHTDQVTQTIYKLESGVIPFGIIGCVEKNGIAIQGDVLLSQTSQADQSVSTDNEGCFVFSTFEAGVPIQVNVSETGVDEKPIITLAETTPGVTEVNLIVGTTYSEPGVTANDTEDGDISANVIATPDVINNPSILDTSTPTSYTIAYDVVDSAGNQATTVERTVNVLAVDVSAPVITLLGDNPLALEQSVSYVEPGFTANDDRDGDLTANVVITGSVDENTPGSYSVSYDVVDSTGNNATTIIRTVNVADTTPPVVSLTGSNSITHERGNTFTDPGATAADNIDGDISASITVSGDVSENVAGTYILSYVATDAAGNPSPVVNRTVQVTDTTAPVLTLIGTDPYNQDLGTAFTDPGASASDFPGDDITSSVIASGNVDTSVAGTYVVSYDVSDAAGNAATTITRSVVVGDASPPTITLLGATPIVHEQGTVYTDAGATANDSVEGDLTSAIVVGGDTVNINASGIYVITYDVADSEGNSAPTVTRSVEVRDTTIPVLSLTGSNPLNHEVNTVFVDPGATATDNIDGDISSSVSVTGTVDAGTVGAYVLTYNVADSSGNSATTITRTVNVIDTGAPSIALIGDNPILHELQTPFTDPGATASDAADGDLTSSIVVTGTVDPNTSATYTLTYNVSDSQSNPATTVTRTVVVADRTAPTLALTGSQTVLHELGSTYVDAGATATDIIDGSLTANIVLTGSVNSNVPGTYQLNYNVSDAAGNAAIAVTRNVTVRDSIAPTISLVGSNPINHEVGTIYTDPGATATDNTDGDISANIGTTGAVNANVVGSYTLTYNVSDAAGNPAPAITRTVNVADTGAPTISITGSNPVNHEINTAYIDAGATASDVVDGDITASIVVTNNVNDSIAGTYSVIYDVSDSNSNAAAQQVRTVNVGDFTAPVITLIGGSTVNVEQGSSYVDSGASAVDNVDGDLTASIVVAGTVDPLVAGNYVISYDVSDAAGNSANQVIRNVLVSDTTPPLITLSGSATTNHEQGTAYSDAGAAATDNIDGDISANITISGFVDANIAGSYALTYNVADTAGNSATTVTRTVVVQDTINPSLSLIGANTIAQEQGTSFVDPGASASDNIDGDITGSIVVTGSVDTNVAGSYTLNYNVSDTGGNAAPEATRTVVVADTTAPSISLIGANPTNHEQGTVYSDAGATAIDLVDGSVTVTTSGSVNVNVAGTYVLSYDAVDTAGNNSVTVTRNVVVADTIAPTISLNGGTSVDSATGELFIDPGFSASDNIDGDLSASVVTSGSLDINTEGSYVLSYDVSDTAGNAAITQTRTVNVVTPSTVSIEAETATIGGTASVASTEVGFTGSGYVDLSAASAGEYLEYTFSANALPYDLSIRYANTTTISVDVVLNGNPVGQISLSSSGGTGIWQLSNTLALTPSAGSNTLRLNFTGASASNIDALTIAPQ